MLSNRLSLSLSQQWLLIAVVTMIPLLSVVSYATWSFYQQIQVQRDIVATADDISDIQGAVNERVRELERYTRQYRLLRDTRFLQPSLEKYEALRASMEALKQLAGAVNEHNDLAVANQQHAELNSAVIMLENLISRLNDTDIAQLDETEFNALLKELTDFRPRFDRAISQYLSELSDASEAQLETILRHLVLMGVITLPLTLMLMGFGFWQMVKPIRRLSSAILNLGHGHWDTPINVPGPKDFQRLGQRLEWMRGQLLAADDQKRTFLRHVSHELKTPLSAIMEAGSLLEDEVPGRINTRQKAVLKILHDNSKNLQELIQQLLNYNVITHSFNPRHSEIDLEALCRKIVRRLDQQSLHHKIVWRFEGHPKTLESDIQLLEMILSNLLANAYHYSPTDSMVKVSWGIEGVAEKQGAKTKSAKTGGEKSAWIAVEDQGPGICESELDKIFQPFVQGSVRRHGPVHGSGVGLAIVSESVSKLGGEVSVDSTLGKGSRFFLGFPLGKAPSNAPLELPGENLQGEYP